MKLPKKIRGLSLIEVLIALAIAGIALMAVIQATTQNIRATNHLKNKTAALWVADWVITETQLGLITLPAAPEIRSDTLPMLDQNWLWQGSLHDTSNPHIKKIIVRVYENENTMENNESILTLVGYFLLSVKNEK